jgi:hypothetical protein
MSKVKDIKPEVSENNVAKEIDGKTNDELKDTITSLQAQYKDYTEKANQFSTLATKAQGALEILFQMVPPEEDNNG